VGEIPHRAGGGNYELETADQEGIDPQATKEVVQEDVTGLIGPFNGCQKVEWSRAGLWFTH
jgi:hypothetical protein